jgi:peptidoglycan/LPS O-acetylase OafA/YrhL
LVVSIIISCTLRSELHYQYLSANPTARFDWSYFSFESNMCFFAMGMYAYRLSQCYKADTKLMRIFVPTIAIVIISALLFFELGKYLNNSSRLDIVLWGIGLSALCIWQGVLPSILIGNKIFEYLGERSFSIYLLHPVVIFYSKNQLGSAYELLLPHIGQSAYFICAALLFSSILIFAELTYRLVEVPGINVSRKLIKTREVA